jgi:hypothetical protein
MTVSLEPGRKPKLFFWQNSNGNEVGVIVERGTELMPIEIK